MLQRASFLRSSRLEDVSSSHREIIATLKPIEKAGRAANQWEILFYLGLPPTPAPVLIELGPADFLSPGSFRGVID